MFCCGFFSDVQAEHVLLGQKQTHIYCSNNKIVIGCKTSISFAHISVTTPEKYFFHGSPVNVPNLMLNYPTISLRSSILQNPGQI